MSGSKSEGSKSGGPKAPTLGEYLAGVDAKGRARATPEAAAALFDPQVLHRRVEALLNELEREAEEERREREKAAGHRSALLLIPDVGAPWSNALTMLLDDSRKAVAAQETREAEAALKATEAFSRGAKPDDPFQTALDDCQIVSNRVLQACNGADPKSPEAISRRQALFNRPAFTPSKPAWENELGSILSAIEAKGSHQTPALVHVVPRLRAALAALSEAVPATGGRVSAKGHWGAPVVVAQQKLFVVVDELVQWAGATASDARNAALLRIVNPNRRGEKTAAEGDGGKGRAKGDGKTTTPVGGSGEAPLGGAPAPGAGGASDPSATTGPTPPALPKK